MRHYNPVISSIFPPIKVLQTFSLAASKSVYVSRRFWTVGQIHRSAKFEATNWEMFGFNFLRIHTSQTGHFTISDLPKTSIDFSDQQKIRRPSVLGDFKVVKYSAGLSKLYVLRDVWKNSSRKLHFIFMFHKVMPHHVQHSRLPRNHNLSTLVRSTSMLLCHLKLGGISKPRELFTNSTFFAGYGFVQLLLPHFLGELSKKIYSGKNVL